MKLPARTAILAMLAMIAFAANSLLCRMALKVTGIDAGSFTSIRIISGALVLWLIVRARGASNKMKGSWLSALALFIYAAGFSFAYVMLPTAAGALILFGAVQATMIGYGLWIGERMGAGSRTLCSFRRIGWPVVAGLVGAIAGQYALDAVRRSCLGHLFLARQGRRRSDGCNGRQFSARGSFCSSLVRSHCCRCLS